MCSWFVVLPLLLLLISRLLAKGIAASAHFVVADMKLLIGILVLDLEI